MVDDKYVVKNQSQLNARTKIPGKALSQHVATPSFLTRLFVDVFTRPLRTSLAVKNYRQFVHSCQRM